MTTVAFSNRELHKMADFVAETNFSWRIFPFEINLKWQNWIFGFFSLELNLQWQILNGQFTILAFRCFSVGKRQTMRDLSTWGNQMENFSTIETQIGTKWTQHMLNTEIFSSHLNLRSHLKWTGYRYINTHTHTLIHTQHKNDTQTLSDRQITQRPSGPHVCECIHVACPKCFELLLYLLCMNF